MNHFKISQEYKQINIVEGYPFNRLDEVWNISQITDSHIVLKNGYLGFGIEKDKFSTYFKLVEENKTSNTVLENGTRVIRNDAATIVILPDGNKGVSKCLPEDEYDAELGYEIALTKAEIKSLTKKLKKLSA